MSWISHEFRQSRRRGGTVQAQRIDLAGLDLKRQKLLESYKTVPYTLSSSPWDHLGPQNWGDGLRRICLFQECVMCSQRGLYGEVLEVGKAPGRKEGKNF